MEKAILTFLDVENLEVLKSLTRSGIFFVVCKLGKVLTVDNLVMRGMVLENWCVMCKNSEETVDDLPLHCPMELWILIFLAFGVNWVMPKMVKDLLQGWEHSPKTFRNKVWNVFCGCFM